MKWPGIDWDIEPLVRACTACLDTLYIMESRISLFMVNWPFPFCAQQSNALEVHGQAQKSSPLVDLVITEVPLRLQDSLDLIF